MFLSVLYTSAILFLLGLVWFLLFVFICKLLLDLHHELRFAYDICYNLSYACTCTIWQLFVLRYHTSSLFGIHVCLVMWDVGNMINSIGYWSCVSGVINIISTCKKIMQNMEEFDFFLCDLPACFLLLRVFIGGLIHGHPDRPWVAMPGMGGGWCWYASLGEWFH